MAQQAYAEATGEIATGIFSTPTEAPAPAEVVEERMPFTVRIVGNEEQLSKAVRIRHAAYARHVPTVAAQLTAPESLDHDPGTVVLLAESKLDGSALGTMRIQTNRYRPLALEQSVELPDWLQGKSLAEATRLGVGEGRIGRVVKTALFKAYYQYCLFAGVEWMVVTGRAPLDRQYERLLFKDVFPAQGFIPMKHVGNIPHRVLALNVESVEPSWRETKHPLFDFFFRTYHPDIDLAGGNFALFGGLMRLGELSRTALLRITKYRDAVRNPSCPPFAKGGTR
ncbi:MAG: hypothetical protein AB1768_18065 [Pseudomonadota bacterium]|jgi:hypothetical protein